MSTSFCGIPSSISHSTVSNRLFEAAARSSPTSMLTSEPSGKYLINVMVPRPGGKLTWNPPPKAVAMSTVLHAASPLT